MAKRGSTNRHAPPATPPVPVRENSGPLVWGLILTACALALFVYWPALTGAFLWDDTGHLTKPELRSFGGLARIWFELGATQQYYPVLHSAFWLEYFVLGNTPTGYHVLNVLLHATAACLLAFVLRRLNVPGAWIAAFLFLLHPVCVESVAWISEQKNTLSAVFYLLATLAYLRFDATRRPIHYALASGLFFLALGTKTVTSTLPAALLVVFWWQRGRLEPRRDVVPLLPWFALAAVAAVITIQVEHRFVGAREEDFDFDALERVLIASRAIWFYLGKLIYPAELIFIYPRWQIDAGAWKQYLPLVGILLLALAAWRWRRHRGPIAAGLIFVGTLFPALGFVNVYPFRFSFVADHFQYLASLAIFALAGAGLARGFARPSPIPMALVTLGLLGLLGRLTWNQSGNYRDDITLYQSVLAKNPAAVIAHNNLGNKLVDAGRAREALPHFEAALKLRPNSALYENSYGYALMSLREPRAAIPHFERVLQLEPTHVWGHVFLGLALASIGRGDEAEEKFRAALRLKPDIPEAHLHLGRALVQRRDFPQAIEHFTTAVRLRPDNPDATYNLALALVLANRLNDALVHFESAARLAPNRAYIHNSYGRALVLAGQLDRATERYRKAVRLDPNLGEAHFNLAQVLRQMGRDAEAAPHFSAATRLGRSGGQGASADFFKEGRGDSDGVER